jgi:hypothetical protein
MDVRQRKNSQYLTVSRNSKLGDEDENCAPLIAKMVSTLALL